MQSDSRGRWNRKGEITSVRERLPLDRAHSSFERANRIWRPLFVPLVTFTGSFVCFKPPFASQFLTGLRWVSGSRCKPHKIERTQCFSEVGSPLNVLVFQCPSTSKWVVRCNPFVSRSFLRAGSMAVRFVSSAFCEIPHTCPLSPVPRPCPPMSHDGTSSDIT
jgi:hypothetical protein